MEKKIYELWVNENEVILLDEENKKNTLFKEDGKLIVKFEAQSANEAITKMNQFLKIYGRK